MDDIRTRKKELRAAVRARRAEMPPEAQKKLSQRVCRRLLSLICFRETELLLLYSAIQGEVDLTPLAEEALKRGKKVAFPRVTGKGQMVYCICRPDELVKGTYGIPAPPEGSLPVTEEMLTGTTLILLPAMLFDEEGYRLGYGGGYYDRFLSSFPGISVGVAAREFIVPALPHSRYDRPVHILVTEKEVKTVHAP